MKVLAILLISVIGITIFSTLFYSVSARRNKGIIRDMYRSYMNMSMGFMFISIGILQLLLPGHSFLRICLISLIFIVGILNLVYGLRNYLQSTKEKDST